MSFAASKTTRGGKRAGAGRKAGSGHGRTVVSSSITLTPEQWVKLDAIRGEQTRSKWIAAKIAEEQHPQP